VAGTDLGGLPGRLPWVAATPTVAPPVPPRADGVPGAAQRPDLVGTDVTVLHVGLDTGKARYAGWGVTQRGVETIRLDAGVGPTVTIDVARSADLLDDPPGGFSMDPRGMRPPTFDGTVRSMPVNGSRTQLGLVAWWSPGAGRYARASTQGQDPVALTRAMAALRWDEAYRCASPLRLTALPAGAQIAGCSVDVSSYPRLVTAEFTLMRQRGQYMWVHFRYAAGVAHTRTEGNRTVDGRPADLLGTKLELLGIPKVNLVADFGWPWEGDSRPTGFTEADATTLLAGARVAKDPTRLDTWE